MMLDISRLFGISYLNNCFSVLQVLSIMDSSYHILKDMKVPSVRQFREKRKHDQELEAVLDYKEKISVNISFIGISLISSYPQVCEKIIFFSWPSRCFEFTLLPLFGRNCFLHVPRTQGLTCFRVWIIKSSPSKSHPCKSITSCTLPHILLSYLLIMNTEATQQAR